MFDYQVGAGYRKYRDYLRTMNGRDPYADFLAEQVDGLMYATQLYLEAKAFVDLVARAVDLFRAEPYLMELDYRPRVEQFIEEAQACLKNSGLSRGWTPSQK